MPSFRARFAGPAAAALLVLGAAALGRPLEAQQTGVGADASAVALSPEPEFGTTAESSVFLGGAAFNGARTNVGVIDDGAGAAQFSGTGGDAEAWAPLHLPQGAKITGIDVHAYDANASQDLSCWLYGFPSVGGVNSLAFLATTGSPGWSVGTQNLASPVTVDNSANTYAVWVGTGFTPVSDGSLKWRGVRVRYKLQVSPAPGIASFTDVPTSYWAFQYIEALKASGITQGVTPTTFEPESTVTRAQMAVFLAKALGLHWPN